MANTIGTTVWRAKYRSNAIEQALRKMLVAEKICAVDRTDSKYIYNPYGSAPTTVVQYIAGTYTPATYTTTNDTLTVADEFIVSEHIYDFEDTLSNFDLFASRTNELAASVAQAIDAWVINCLLEDGTGTYSTPAGGFTTAANVNTIVANLISKVAGYQDVYRGLFLVVENTDLPGIIQAAATNGFSFADAALNNGYVTSYMGVDIYVLRTGTIGSTPGGTRTYANSSHRVFGVKGVATYAAPRGVKFEEKYVTATTGKEVVCFGYVGFKLWATKASLIVDITLV